MQNLLLAGGACVLLVGSLLWKEPVAAGHLPATGTIVMAQTDTALNGEWFLQPVMASDTAAGRYPTIRFNVARSTFTGNTGCNRMSGTFIRTDTSLTFSDRIALTKMVCTGYNEAAFLKTLLNTNRYKKEEGVLILMFNQTELSRWTRKPYRAPLGKGT